MSSWHRGKARSAGAPSYQHKELAREARPMLSRNERLAARGILALFALELVVVVICVLVALVTE